MGRVFDEMKRFFDQDDWKYQQFPDKPILRMGFSGDDGTWTCFAQAREEHQQFIFYSVAAVKCPEDRRPIMAEFITRANYGMIIGNFEMDYSDGEIRYKTSIDIEDSELSYDLAKHAVWANCLTMDRYLKGILAVAFGGQDAVAAVAMIEG